MASGEHGVQPAAAEQAPKQQQQQPKPFRSFTAHTVRPYVQLSSAARLLAALGVQPADGPASNELRTSKYNVATFLPVNLFEQFTRVANLYFLLIAVLQLIPGLSPTSWFTTVCPLVFVLTINAIKEGYDDFHKHRCGPAAVAPPPRSLASLWARARPVPPVSAGQGGTCRGQASLCRRRIVTVAGRWPLAAGCRSDDEVNSRKVLVITETDGEVPVSWRDVVVGDILKVGGDGLGMERGRGLRPVGLRPHQLGTLARVAAEGGWRHWRSGARVCADAAHTWWCGARPRGPVQLRACRRCWGPLHARRPPVDLGPLRCACPAGAPGRGVPGGPGLFVVLRPGKPELRGDGQPGRRDQPQDQVLLQQDSRELPARAPAGGRRPGVALPHRLCRCPCR
jgi:hypothetical protein